MRNETVSELEERANELASRSVTKSMLAGENSRRVKQARDELERIEAHIASTQRHIQRMKNEYPVVLLNEYDRSKRSLDYNEVLRKERLADIARYGREAQIAQDQAEALERELRVVADEIKNRSNNVIPFRR